jgi:hypothetical protein
LQAVATPGDYTHIDKFANANILIVKSCYTYNCGEAAICPYFRRD